MAAARAALRASADGAPRGYVAGRVRRRGTAFAIGLAAAAVGAAASGVGGAIGFKLFHSTAAPLAMIWRHWFASDAVGIITVAPLLIGFAAGLRRPPNGSSSPDWPREPRRRL